MRVIGRWSVASFISACLNLTQFITALGLIVVALFLGILPFIPSPKLAVTVPVSFSLDMPSQIQAGRSGFDFEILNEQEQARQNRRGRLSSVNGSLRIPDASKRLIAANAFVLIVEFLFVLYITRKLHSVFQTLIHGNPFVAENAIRIRRVAFAVIISDLVGAAIVFAENSYATAHVAIAGLRFDVGPHINGRIIGYGLIILVIAEVFRAGTRLDEEQSLTI
jgi:hypothetical protein